ncbi:MAG TPA: glycogen synthase [Flavobacterium sp.]|nr:glycogen synthase [Flavobacterium sp.]
MTFYHISAECYPVAKVGGLADVVGALPKYQKKLGYDARVVMPAYDNKFTRENEFLSVHKGKVRLGWFVFSYEVLREATDKLGFGLYVIAIPELFDRPNVYSYEDDTERFTAFQIAFLNWLIESGQRPDLLHCHDHHTGLIPFMVQHCYNYHELQRTPLVVTIHNGQYQGWFGFDKLHYIPDFDRSRTGFLEWGGMINPLAAAIKCAWKVTTVSPSYLDEIATSANGLENLLRWERPKSVGLLNGIDTEVWNPATDPMLAAHYDSATAAAGKKANKEHLCTQFGLDPERPLFVFIGRLVHEKGADLLPTAFGHSLTHYQDAISLLVLGSGDPSVEQQLETLKAYFPSSYNAYIGYNETLSHLMYAGADFLLMPSRVEPCGLNQMYALRYGTVPIVRRTGGLKDTVIDFGDGGFGICHDQASVFDINYSIDRAMGLYADEARFASIRDYVMGIDHSWDAVADDYIRLYQSLQ